LKGQRGNSRLELGERGIEEAAENFELIERECTPGKKEKISALASFAQ
jgi:hypothetical protein